MKKLLAAMFVALLMVGCGEKEIIQDGPYTEYYGNGQKEFEGYYKDGKEDGPSTWWYSNGQKKEECTYNDGKPMSIVAWKINGDKCPHTNVVNGNGVVVEYYDDGTEKGRLTLKDGKLVGTSISFKWYSNGQKKWEATYKGFKLMTAVVWKPDGEKCPVTNVVDGNGVWVEYNDDGTEKYRETYKDHEEVR